jgi:hypothetical protein
MTPAPRDDAMRAGRTGTSAGSQGTLEAPARRAKTPPAPAVKATRR